MKKFKIRASGCGEIMTNPRYKNEILSKTTKTFCKTWTKEQLFNRKKIFTNQFLEKGNLMEFEAIELLKKQTNKNLHKNEDFFENDYMQGTPDIIDAENETVIDIKCSWGLWSFPMFEEKINKIYWWQLQTYMILLDLPRAELVYCLMDTPEQIIKKEIYYKFKDIILGEEEQMQFMEQIKQNLTYSDAPINLRIVKFQIEKDLSAEAQIIERVKECRTFIQKLL